MTDPSTEAVTAGLDAVDKALAPSTDVARCPDATEGTAEVAMDATPGMTTCSLSAEIIAECGSARCVHLNDSGPMCEKLDNIRKLATNIEELSQPRSRTASPSDREERDGQH